jgi:hypothetical protein
MLRRMAAGDTPLADLGAASGLPRLAVWERINGLVAVGLAGRRHGAVTAYASVHICTDECLCEKI